MSDSQVTAAPPAGWKLWFVAVRPFSFTASVIPVLVGALAGLAVGEVVQWWLLPAVLVAGVAIHAGTNLFNDTHDFKRGVDREGTLGGSGLLVAGHLSPRAAAIAAATCFALATGLGAWFIVLRGWPVALVGGLGLLGGYAYTGRPLGYKYVALGDPMVFLLMGPLMVVGSDLVLTGAFHLTTVWISIPIGLLVMSILHGNNLRDLEDDRASGFLTVAMLLNERGSRAWYAAMVLGAFVVAAVLAVLGILPAWTALLLLALPASLRNVLRVVRRDPATDRLVDIDVRSAQLHAQFGALLCVALLLGKLV